MRRKLKVKAGQLEYVVTSIAAEVEAETKMTGEPRTGSLCPRCGEGKLDYDGLLNLTCPGCGYTAGGCFT